jgi:hypothetical protein
MDALPTDVNAFKQHVHEHIGSLISDPPLVFENTSMKYLPQGYYGILYKGVDRYVRHFWKIDDAIRAASKPFRLQLRLAASASKWKIFYIALYSKTSTEALIAILQAPGLRDNTLPFYQDSRPSAVTESEWDLLIEHQYLFLAASFTAGVFDQEIHSDGPIPVSGPFDKEDAGAGAISNIFDAYIDADHHNFGTEDGFVIKRIGDKDEARRATRVLADLESSPGAQHEHLARTYSAFRWDRTGCTYLITERANDNLNSFMENNPREPWPDHVDGNWLLSQLRGLASALDAVHTGVPGKSVVHHDIRPTNILVFTDEESGISTLKITNWSHATTMLHDSSTGPVSHNSPTTSRSSYHAPEYYSDEPSAAHDIWSLGCIFLELLIWHTKGWEYLEEWRRGRENAHDDSFYVDGGGSQLAGIVDAELEWLHSNGFPGQSAIIRQMLSFNKEARPSASQVERGIWEEED